MSDSQTPLEETAERLAESSPARTIPFLIGLENMRGMMAHWRQRNMDDHEMNKQLLSNAAGTEFESAEPEEMGDINVSGDSTKTENHYHYPEPKPAEAGKEAPSAVRKLLPLALALATGAGGLWLYENLSKFEWPGVADTEYEVRFFNSDGELIEVPRHTDK